MFLKTYDLSIIEQNISFISFAIGMSNEISNERSKRKFIEIGKRRQRSRIQRYSSTLIKNIFFP